MATNTERSMTSFVDTMQAKFRSLCNSWISLPTIFQRTRGSQSQWKPQFKSKQETNMAGSTQEAQSSRILNWLVEYDSHITGDIEDDSLTGDN